MKSDLANIYEQFTDREFFIVGRVIAFIWLIKVLMFNPMMASEYPFDLIIPTGILSLLSEEALRIIITLPVLAALKVALIVLLILFQIRVQSIWTGFLLLILLLVYSNINHSFGSFLNHAEIAVFVSLLIFILASGIRKSDSGRNTNSHIIFFFILTTGILLVCYSLIGSYRVIHGGFELFTGDYMIMTVMERSIQRVDTVFTLGVPLAKFAWFAPLLNAFFLITTILEILSPFIFFNKVFRLAWLTVMIPFHVSTLFFMNIFFWENILLILMLTTPVLKYADAGMKQLKVSTLT